jgi:Mlc titration factor MtfA (ptsG expression regulator)
MDAGEAWQNGQVVLSWQDVLSDCRNPDDGRNLFIHVEIGVQNGPTSGS